LGLIGFGYFLYREKRKIEKVQEKFQLVLRCQLKINKLNNLHMQGLGVCFGLCGHKYSITKVNCVVLLGVLCVDA